MSGLLGNSKSDRHSDMSDTRQPERTTRPTNFALPFKRDHPQPAFAHNFNQTGPGSTNDDLSRAIPPALFTAAISDDDPPAIRIPPIQSLKRGLRSDGFTTHKPLTGLPVTGEVRNKRRLQRAESRDFFDLDSSESDPGDVGEVSFSAITEHPDLMKVTITDASTTPVRERSLERASLQLLRRKRSLGSGYTSSYGGSALAIASNKSAEQLLSKDATSSNAGLGIFRGDFPSIPTGVGQDHANTADLDATHCYAGQVQTPETASLHPSPVHAKVLNRISGDEKLGDLFGGDYNVRLFHLAANANKLAHPPDHLPRDGNKSLQTREGSLASVIYRPCVKSSLDMSIPSVRATEPDPPPAPQLPHAQRFDQAGLPTPSSVTHEVNRQRSGLLQHSSVSQVPTRHTDARDQVTREPGPRSQSDSAHGKLWSDTLVPARAGDESAYQLMPEKPPGSVTARQASALTKFPLQPQAIELHVRVRRRQVNGRYLSGRTLVRLDSHSFSISTTNAMAAGEERGSRSAIQTPADDEAVFSQLRKVYLHTLLGSTTCARAWRRFLCLKRLKRVALVPTEEDVSPSPAGVAALHHLSGQGLFAGLLDPSRGRRKTVIVSQLRKIAADSNNESSAPGGRPDILRAPFDLEMAEDWSVRRSLAMALLILLAAAGSTVAWIICGPNLGLVPGSGRYEQRVVGGALIGIMVLVIGGFFGSIWTFLSWVTM